MPLYEYRCEACQHQFELIQRFSDDPVTVCPSCGGGPVVKLLSSPAIQFKGSGWYITDYARKGKASETKAEGAAGSSGTETKPASEKSGGTTSAAGSKPSSDSSSATKD